MKAEAYRILLLGGPDDGETLIAHNPWYQVTTDRGNVYLAEQDDEGQPLMEEGDSLGGNIETITCNGDVYSPSVATIRMSYSHTLTGRELAQWQAQKSHWGDGQLTKGDTLHKRKASPSGWVVFWGALGYVLMGAGLLALYTQPHSLLGPGLISGECAAFAISFYLLKKGTGT